MLVRQAGFRPCCIRWASKLSLGRPDRGKNPPNLPTPLWWQSGCFATSDVLIFRNQLESSSKFLRRRADSINCDPNSADILQVCPCNVKARSNCCSVLTLNLTSGWVPICCLTIISGFQFLSIPQARVPMFRLPTYFENKTACCVDTDGLCISGGLCRESSGRISHRLFMAR